MRRIQHKHTVSGVFVFLLLGIFAVSSTVMVLIGAQAYNGSAQRGLTHNVQRLAPAYVRGRLREADEADMLDLEGLDGADMLKIFNSDEGTATILYVYDGMLYEWYTLESLARNFEVPEIQDAPQQAQAENAPVVVRKIMGESVCELDEIKIDVEGNLVKVNLRNGQEWTEVDYAARTAAQR